MRKPLVAGNWKMNGSREQAGSLIGDIINGLNDHTSCDIVLCPPFVYLADVARELRGSGIALGAQDVCAEEPGAYTGEVAAVMLQDFECRYVIVGHSERRGIYSESDALVARKFLATQKQGLTPILCVGETLEEREAGDTLAVVERQLRAVLDVAGIEAFSHAVVAYEPVWAIGTGHTATPEQAQEVHAALRGILSSEDGTIGDYAQLLYGGSVKVANASALFAMPDIDGGLIGGAALDAEQFLAICRAASE